MMSQLEITRRIRENIHGTIDITRLEDLVISHPMFQRLRRIKQLAFLQYVFPSASHSRFEHSLGVMHLAGVAWKKLFENQRSLRNSVLKYENFSALELRRTPEGPARHGLLSPTFPIIDEISANDYALQALRLAALMHDCGHSPFSHSGEGFMPTWSAMKETESAPPYVRQFINLQCSKLLAKNANPEKVKVRHELYTLLFIDRILNDIYRDNPVLGTLRISPQDVASIISPDIPPEENSPLLKYGLHHLCHELVSGELDVDRMDYLLRDSRECGVVYGIFDESRILNSLAVYWDESAQCIHLAVQFSGLAAFEDYLRARHSMYLQVYFHKTSAAAEAMIQYITSKLPNWSLPTNLDDYAKIDEYNIPAILENAGKTNITSKSELDYFLSLLTDLMFHRKLWKRVFEVASNTKHTSDVESINEAATVITSLGVRWEKVSSTNSLTRFRPRHTDAPSPNTLRLIKKDNFQFPRVIPIEDQMSLVNHNSQMHITRIYIENNQDTSSKSSQLSLVRDALNRLIEHTEARA